MDSVEERLGNLETSVESIKSSMASLETALSDFLKIAGKQPNENPSAAAAVATSGIEGRHPPRLPLQRAHAENRGDEGHYHDHGSGMRWSSRAPRDDERHDRDHGGGRRWAPHAPRYDLPIFDGADDPLLWLKQCERFGRMHEIPEDEWVAMAGGCPCHGQQMNLEIMKLSRWMGQ